MLALSINWLDNLKLCLTKGKQISIVIISGVLWFKVGLVGKVCMFGSRNSRECAICFEE